MHKCERGMWRHLRLKKRMEKPDLYNQIVVF